MPNSSAGGSEIRCKFLGLSLAPLGLMSILSGLVILAVTEWHAVYVWKGNRAVTTELKKTATCSPADQNTNHLVSVRNCQIKSPPGAVPVQDHILAGLARAGFPESLPIVPEQSGFLAFHRDIQQYQFVLRDGVFTKEWVGEFVDLSADDKNRCQQQLGEPCENRVWPKAFDLNFSMLTPKLLLDDGNGGGYRVDPNTFSDGEFFSDIEAKWEILKVQDLHTSPIWHYGDYVIAKNLRDCGNGWLHLNNGHCTPAMNGFRIRWRILPKMESVVAVGKQIKNDGGYELVGYKVEGYSEKPTIAVITNSVSKVESLLPLSEPGVSVYLLRVSGYLLSWLGAHLVLSSLESSRVASFIFSVRELSNTKLFVFGNTTATFLSLLTIGVIWVTVQSILAIPLILSLVSVVGIFFVIRRTGHHRGGYDDVVSGGRVPVIVHTIQSDGDEEDGDDDDDDDEEGSLAAVSGVGVLPDDGEVSTARWLSARPPSPPLRKTGDVLLFTTPDGPSPPTDEPSDC